MNYRYLRTIFFTGIALALCMSCRPDESASHERELRNIVDQIMQARSAKKMIPAVSMTHENFSLSDAYRVQVELSRELAKQYGPIVGYKLGYSDSISFRKYHVNVPAYGPIFKNQIKNSGDTISASVFHNFSLENEIVFTISKSIDKKVHSIKELKSYVKAVQMGFDISEAVFRDPMTMFDFISDAAGSKYVVLSEKIDPLSVDLTDINLSVTFEDSLVYNGNSKQADGNPWIALRAVANDLVKRGYPLKAGNIVFSGKLAPAYKVPPEKARGLYTGHGSPFADIFIRVK